MQEEKVELYLQENFKTKFKPEPIKNSLETQMVAMGKALMRAKKQMDIVERKALIMALTKMNWSKKEENNIVELDKIEICEILGWNYNASDRSVKLRRLFKALANHSYIEMNVKDKDEWDDGFLIPRISSTRGSIKVYFAEQFMPLLTNLLQDKDFVTIWSNDIYKFENVNSYLLFEELRLHSDTRQTNWRTYSTKQLKELFGMPKTGKGAYMHYSAKDQKEVFDRSNFEKYVLDKAIAEINKGQMIKILPIVGSNEIKKGKLYQKIKKNGFVVGYQFKYIVKTSITAPLIEE